MAATDSNEQQLRFRWNDHVQHLSKVLTLQRLQDQYCDITLVSEDGFLTKAHQAILASTSSYFEQVLADIRPEQHPMVVLRGANLQELTCLLDFMYQGNTQVEQSLIESVLEVADLLGVKGLSGIRANPAIQKFMATPSSGIQQDTHTPATATQEPTTATTVPQQDTHTPTTAPQEAPTPNTPTDANVAVGKMGANQIETGIDQQMSGIDLSMSKNEPRSPKDLPRVTSEVTAEVTQVNVCEELCVDGVLESSVGHFNAGRKKRRLDSPNSEDNLDPDWGKIGDKLGQSPRPTAADTLPRTITLTAVSSAAAASSGAGLRVERSVEVPCQAGPLTITLTTGHDNHTPPPRPLTRRRPLIPLASPSPPAAAALRRARRRLRGRRSEEGRRRWLGRDRHTLDAAADPPVTRLRRREAAQYTQPTLPCDLPYASSVRPAPVTHSPDALQAGGCLTQAADNLQFCTPQQMQMQNHTDVPAPATSLPQHLGECDLEEGEGDTFPAVSPLALFSLPPTRPRAKQRRTTLTLEQKVKVVEAFLEGKSQRQIAGLYGTGKTQVSGIIRRREEVLAAYRDSLLRGERLTAQRRKRRGGYARLNQHLIQWYRHAVGAGGARVTAGMLRAKALQLAPQLGYHDFKASNGWLATFKANHNLKFSRPGRAPPPPTVPNDTDEDPGPARRHTQPGAFVEEGEAEGSCGGPAPQRPEAEEDLGPARQTLDPCESPVDPSDPGGLLHPGLSGAGLPKPPQMVNSIGANLSAAYNLSRDLTRDLNRGDAGPDLSVMSASPLGHPGALGRGVEGPVKAPEGPLSAYKSEEPLAYAYDPQNRMAEAAPPRPAEYNYAPYGFPGSYYGYHFLGQY